MSMGFLAPQMSVIERRSELDKGSSLEQRKQSGPLGQVDRDPFLETATVQQI